MNQNPTQNPFRSPQRNSNSNAFAVKVAANGHALLACLTLGVTSLSGCSSLDIEAGQTLVLGENAAYLVFNDSSEPVIEMPSMLDQPTGRRLYSNLQASSVRPQVPAGAASATVPASGNDPTGNPFNNDPGDENLSLPRWSVQAFIAAGAHHRVPEHVLVTWRQLPRAGQNQYAGHAAKPLKVAVRSQIPADVLALVSNQWRYRLDIAVSANSDAPALRWRVMNVGEQLAHEVRRGGNW